jgi:hypothetical protein
MSYAKLNNGTSIGYVSTAENRAERMKERFAALAAADRVTLRTALQTLQQRQVDEICGLLERSGIGDARTAITNIEDINNLFTNLSLSGGRKSRRRKSRKSMKSRRRRY